MSFTHLHVHSELSRLDGMSRIPELAAEAARMGMPALGLTDHGHCFGAMKHWKACSAVGIRPVIGAELYLAPGERSEKVRDHWGDLEEGEKLRSVPGGYTHLTVIAQNVTGLKNLYALQELSYLEGFYSYPRVDLTALADHSDGLIVLSGCAGSAISTRLRLDQPAEAAKLAGVFKEIFEDQFFIEIMHHGLSFEDELNRSLIGLAHTLDLPLVGTNDSHYTRPEDAKVHDAMLCLQTNAKLSDENRFRFTGSGFYLKSPQEMAELFREAPEAVTNTLAITDMVESYDEMFRHQELMPVIEGRMPEVKSELGSSVGVPGGERSDIDIQESGLQSQVHAALKAKGLDQMVDYVRRAAREVQTFEDLGFAGYIQVIADLCRFARSRGILVGPARGSAGGSLVCFLLGITTIDPIEHSLVFERFLNRSRVSPPDVDIDFQQDRRDEIFAYAAEKYGARHAAKILTFATMATRYAIKDAARVLGREPKEAQRLANLVPPLKRGRQVSLNEVQELKIQDPEVYELASGLEGMVRGYGKHAAGLAISPRPLAEVIPVKRDPKDEILMTGFENSELEELGIMKIDILGLENLTTIQRCLDMIK